MGICNNLNGDICGFTFGADQSIGSHAVFLAIDIRILVDYILRNEDRFDDLARYGGLYTLPEFDQWVC